MWRRSHHSTVTPAISGVGIRRDQGMRLRTIRGFGIGLAALLLVCAASGEESADTLIQAIRNNDLASLKTALSKGADVTHAIAAARPS